MKLAKDAMGNKKSFYYHKSNRRINNDKVGLLLNRAGNLVTEDKKEAWIVNAFFASFFTGQTSLQQPFRNMWEGPG